MRVTTIALKFWRLFVAALVLVALYACEPAGEVLTVLRIGVLPDQSKDALERRYTPLFEHISATIGIKYELMVPRDYDHLLELFHEKKVDLAYFGGLTFLKARLADDAIPIATRDVDSRFVSYFLVRTDNAAMSLQDLDRRVLAFGPKLSTSGHLMPRHFMQQNGLIPERHFAEIIYTRGHDETAYLVHDGLADVGAVNALIAEAMFADGRLSRDAFRIISRTPPYPDYVWTMRPGIAMETRELVQDAFMSLSVYDTTHAAVLGKIGARSFLPISPKDYDVLAEIAMNLGLLGG
jgi:phosphonate transport system substrate-binding protein